MNKTTHSYKNFTEIYELVFNKLNNSTDTIFENMDYKPNVDVLYEDFIKSPDYQLYLEANSNIMKDAIITNWIYENVFLDSYFYVKEKLITENEELPYNIEYKLNNSIDAIMEGRVTASISAAVALGGLATAHFASGFIIPAIGLAVAGLAAVIGLSDTDRRAIINALETTGKFIGKIITFDIDGLPISTKKEILAAVDAQEIADTFEECVRIVGWNPRETNKITRFIERITNSHKEYDYVRCVGTKIIKFYVSSLDALYKILRASDVDEKVFDVVENSLKRGALNEVVFRNLARLVRNKNIYKLIEVVNKTNEEIGKMLDTLSNSKDPEYARIGHDLSKILESELRNLAFKINKERRDNRPRPPLNRRNDGTEIMKDRNDRNNRNNNHHNKNNHNPF